MFSAYGGNVTSQQWNIDGLNLASPEGGWLGWSINPEIVAETSIKGFGAGAEYGSTMGNVYNMVTKSGTNSFHGSIGGLLDDNDLVDPNVTLDESNLWDYRLWDPAGEYTIDEYYDTPRDPRRADPQGQAVVLRRRPVGQTSTSWVPTACRASTAPARPTTATTSSSPTQIGNSHRVDVRGHTATTDMVPAPDMYTELSAVLVYDIDIDMLTADYNGVLTDTTLLNVRAGTWSKNQDMDSRTGSDRGVRCGCHVPRPTPQLRRDLLVQRPQGGVHPGRRGGVALRRRVHHGEPRVQVRRPVQRGQRREDGGQVQLRVEAAAEPGVPVVRLLGVPLPDHAAHRSTARTPRRSRCSCRTRGSSATSCSLDIGVRYDDQEGGIPDYPLLDARRQPDRRDDPGRGHDPLEELGAAPRLRLAAHG